MKQLPQVKRIKEGLAKNPKIKMANMEIPLCSDVKTPLLKDILESNPEENLYIKADLTKKILSLASLTHEKRKSVVKGKLSIPDKEKDLPDGHYICTHHLGQNGGLVSEISRTMTCTDTPHVTVKINEN